MKPAATRRLLHALSASVLLLFYLGSAELLRFTLIGGAIAAISLDALRLRHSALATSINRLVPVFRSSESTRLCGATWLCIGYAIAAWFPHPASTSGILVGALADPAASFVGSKVQSSTARKTWIGTGTVAIVAVVSLALLGLPLRVALPGAFASAALERWSGRFNDNLLLAPGVGSVVWLLM